MKVLWQQHGKEEATGEPEATMRALYPKLFTLGNNFEEKNSFKGGGGGGGGGVEYPNIGCRVGGVT